MFNFVEETLLREYFLHGSVLGEFAPCKKIFDYLAKAFDLPARRAKTLFNLTEQESVKEIATGKDANRYKRIVQFLRESNRESLYDAQTDALITVKSEAIAVATESRMCLESKTTGSKLYQTLQNRASSGDVAAMRILGVLQLNGLFVEKDVTSGETNLVKAAEWGDVISAFLLIRHGANHPHVESNFYAATHNTPYSALVAIAKMEQFQTEQSGDGDTEIELLNRLFNQKLVKRNVYSPSHARVLYATGISREDKEKVLFSENNQLVAEVANLPIYKPTTELPCHVEGITNLSLQREKEQNQLVCALQNRDLRTWSKYKPLCLATNSPYLQQIYAKALERCFEGEAVSRIRVANLQESDFEPTANNVFVRASKGGNVFLLFVNGEVSDWALKRVKDFLVTDLRRQFRLVRPSLTLNLSYVLPICICDGTNAQKLKGLVETVQIADVDSDETSKILEHILRKKSRFYFNQSVEITDKPLELLANFTLEQSEDIIDMAFRSMRAKFNGEDKVAFALKPFVDGYKQQFGQRSYGFGGFNK